MKNTKNYDANTALQVALNTLELEAGRTKDELLAEQLQSAYAKLSEIQKAINNINNID